MTQASTFLIGILILTGRANLAPPPVAASRTGGDRDASVLATLSRLQSAQRGPAPLTEVERATMIYQIDLCVWLSGYDAASFDVPFAVRLQLDDAGRIRAVAPANVGGPSAQQSRPYDAVRRGLVSQACDLVPLPQQRHQAVMAAAFRFVPTDRRVAERPSASSSRD